MEKSLLMELKAYKLLAELRGNMLSFIRNEAKTKIVYNSNKPEEMSKLLLHIADPSKWNYCGLLKNEDKKVLETLEYLLNDDDIEIYRYKEWKQE